MLDLWILETSFGRIVLSVAVIDDLVMYAVLAAALGLAGERAQPSGLPALIGLPPASVQLVAYHVLATIALLGAAFRGGPLLRRSAAYVPARTLLRAGPAVVRLGACVVALGLGVAPFLGAFAAGIAMATAAGADPRAASVRQLAAAFFIPIQFAVVGLRIDLIHAFDPLLFVALLVYASAAKAGSVYLGSLVAGESHRAATNLAVDLNARGGPGIVVASVAYDAGIIDRVFFSALVMLAVVTSLIAGTWLERAVRTRQPLLDR